VGVQTAPGTRVHPHRCPAYALRRIVLALLATISFLIPASAQKNAAARYEIDAKRIGVSLESEDALPRSREFLRIDSTYYVGWLMEGSYKFKRAADYLGFRNAAVPLERALRLMERDFRLELSTRSSSLAVYYPVYKYHVDYAIIAQMLNTCYTNTDEPAKVYSVLRRYLRWNFQKDYFDAYNHLMWLTHRNRFYTRAQYPFLADGIDANERLAHVYLDSCLAKIYRSRAINAAFFPAGSDEQEILGVYHYKAVLHAYAFAIDSAEWYFEKLRDGGMLSQNNYANFKAVTGDFRAARTAFDESRSQFTVEKALEEWAYYTPILDVYAGKPKDGARLARDMVKAAGSTPGFGWYNIALARCLLYDGQLREADLALEKAAGFKELHIGTTLGQPHYDFSVQMQRLTMLSMRAAMPGFENRGWWYKPGVLSRMAGARAERLLQQYIIVNQFAQNPERDRVIYTLFSTESTVSWDEVWTLIGDFSTAFFLKRFEDQLATDKRPAIRRYFQYFTARLHMRRGDWAAAEDTLRAVLAARGLDTETERLLIARCEEALSLCADARDNDAEAQTHAARFTELYPQLVPFSEVRAPMRLTVVGTPDQDLVDRLRECNVDWDPPGTVPAPQAVIALVGAAGPGRQRVEYWTTDSRGRYIVPRQSCTYLTENAEAAGVSLAYRLFGIGGIGGEEISREAPEERGGI